MNRNSIRRMRTPVSVLVAIAGGLPFASTGAVLDTGNSDVRISWDNTFKYSAGWRVEDPSRRVAGDPLTGQINTDDGDLNFDRGLISSRVDLLSEFDFSY